MLDYFGWGARGWSDELAYGLLVTVELSVCSYALGLVLGVLGATLALGPRAFRTVANGYMVVGRGIPELLIIFLMFYGANQAARWALSFVGVNRYVEVSPFICGVLALGFIVGAGAASILRGALLAIETGQREAGRALGMRAVHIFLLIVLPQVVRLSLPGLSNLWMGMLKETALVSAIGLTDVLRMARVAGGSMDDPLPFLLAAGGGYLVLTAVSLLVIRDVNQRFAKPFIHQ